MAQRELAFQGKKVNVHIAVDGETEIHRGTFIAMDDSGLLIQRRDEYLYFPPERIVMIGTAATREAF